MKIVIHTTEVDRVFVVIQSIKKKAKTTVIKNAMIVIETKNMMIIAIKIMAGAVKTDNNILVKTVMIDMKNTTNVTRKEKVAFAVFLEVFIIKKR